MAQKERIIKKDKKEIWQSFTEEEYQREYNNLVHFSAKTVNSNADIAGVRLAGDGIDLPYISVSTYSPSNIHLDYMKMVAPGMAIAKQVNAVLFDSNPSLFDKAPKDEIDFILNASKMGGACFDYEIDCRLKQIIMCDEEGNDFCLTPLHSAGLSQAINSHEKALVNELNEIAEAEAAKAEAEAEEKAGVSKVDGITEATKVVTKRAPIKLYKLFSRALMPFGGSKPWNAGTLTINMKRPLYFAAPREDMELKKALSIYYRGVDYLPFSVVDAYLDWYDKFSEKHGMEIRLTEEGYLKKITSFSLYRGQLAYEILLVHADEIKSRCAFKNNEEVLDSSVGIAQQGLIIKSARTAEWREAFSLELAELITHRKRYRLREWQNQEIGSKLESPDMLRIQAIIKGELL